MLVEKLQKLGLNESEARAYQILLNKGWMLPSQLAKELSLSQTAAKNILEFLIKEGLVKGIKIQKKFFYSVDSPEKIKEYCFKREQIILKKIHKEKKIVDDVIKEANLLYGDFSGPSAFFIEGVENIKDIHEMVLGCKEKKVYEIVPLDKVSLKPKKGDHRCKMKKSGIEFKVIYSSKNGPILKNEKNIKRYYLPKRESVGEITSEIVLFDDKIVFFSESQTKNMVLTDKCIMETLKCLFLTALESKKIQEAEDY